jgi:hypothetical protein
MRACATAERSLSRDERRDLVEGGAPPGLGVAAARGRDAMARHAGFEGFELIDAPVIDGHPRVIGALGSGPLD